MAGIWNISPDWNRESRETADGVLTPMDNDDYINTPDSAEKIEDLMDRSVKGGQLFNNPIISTYSLIYTAGGYLGLVLNLDSELILVPALANRGQKIGIDNTVSTFTLVYSSTTTLMYFGGVLAPNGDVHFIPRSAPVGQKISKNGVVSTYSLAYTTTNAYYGGVIAPNGDIHFVPEAAPVGQKIAPNGTVSTYSLVYTGSYKFKCGVIDLNGNVQFIPGDDYPTIGQKVSPTGVVSTYSLVYSRSGGLLWGYTGGVLSPDGSIYMVSSIGTSIGQKINTDGNSTSTYSLVYAPSNAFLEYFTGVLAPNGDVHFIPYEAKVGQKISSTGVVSTYSIPYTPSVGGPTYLASGILSPNGDIYALNFSANKTAFFAIFSLGSGKPLGPGTCLSPFFNKF